ncbi:MAG TPA: hypothetical protein VFR47_17520 [Anaerolineales bacterium]|nr:hypothetical protein [Anaerolineales bacterium]
MNDNLSEVEQRVKRYWYVDGFGELVGGGGMCLILAIYFAAGQYLGDDSPVGGLLQASMALVLIGGFFLVRRLINAAKMQVTYPRTGYVEYQTTQGNRFLAGALSAVVGFVMAMLFVFIVRQFNRIDAMVAISGVVMGLILFVKQVRTVKVSRFYILSLAALTYGMALSVSGLPRGYNLGLFYALMSISFAISGGLTLKKYLDENPLQPELGNGR